MKTEKLIQELSSHLSPVKRIYPTWLTVSLWIFFSIVSTILFIWNRSNFFANIHIPVFYYELIFICLISLTSVSLAISTSIPGNRIESKYFYLPLIILFVLLASIIFRFYNSVQVPSISNLNYHSCTKDLFYMAIAPTAILFYLINRRLPNKLNWIGFWILIASTSMSALGVAFLCPNEFPLHTLFVHAMPILYFSVFGILLGRLLFIQK